MENKTKPGVLSPQNKFSEVIECDNEQMSGNELVPFKSTNEGEGSPFKW